MKVAFLLPRIDRPAGGHAIIVEHIRILRENGIDACAVFSGGVEVSYYENHLPQAALGHAKAIGDRESYLVIPEADLSRYADFVLQARGNDFSRVIILNQNHFYTFNHRDDPVSWRVFRNAKHVGTSRAIASFLRDITGSTVPVVPVFIRHDIFRPAPKLLRIAYMPRKRPEDARFLRRAVHEIAPDQRVIEWIEIDNKSQEEVADILNASAVFVSLARREGFGMPALEAMAAGCLVVGFTGGGGDEYAADDNGLWTEEGDMVALATAVVRLCRDLVTGAPHLRDISRNAQYRASVYTRSRTEVALMEAWSNISGNSFVTNRGATI